MLSLDTISEPHRAVLTAAATEFDATHDFSLLAGALAFMITGAHAYGTDNADSDYDYLLVVLPPPRYLIGFGEFTHWTFVNDAGADLKVVSIARYVKLAAQGNPNMIETLFFAPEMYLYVSSAFDSVMRNGEAFVSRETFKRFLGYAAGQLKKMESGKHLNDMGAKRKKWVDTIGYDPKDASHLCRLLINANEMARLGRWSPRLERENRRFVRDVKFGYVPLDNVKTWAAAREENALAWFNERGCPLAEKAQLSLIEDLLIEIQSHEIALEAGCL